MLVVLLTLLLYSIKNKFFVVVDDSLKYYNGINGNLNI